MYRMFTQEVDTQLLSVNLFFILEPGKDRDPVKVI